MVALLMKFHIIVNDDFKEIHEAILMHNSEMLCLLELVYVKDFPCCMHKTVGDSWT